MAATLTPICATGIRASAASGHRRPDPDRRRSSSVSWWTPLFGWSSEPDYIDSNNSNSKGPGASHKADSDPAAARPRFAGGFTAEKAKQLRIMTVGTESFHDTMYHSAIASRLASDFNAGADE